MLDKHFKIHKTSDLKFSQGQWRVFKVAVQMPQMCQRCEKNDQASEIAQYNGSNSNHFEFFPSNFSSKWCNTENELAHAKISQFKIFLKKKIN